MIEHQLRGEPTGEDDHWTDLWARSLYKTIVDARSWIPPQWYTHRGVASGRLRQCKTEPKGGWLWWLHGDRKSKSTNVTTSRSLWKTINCTRRYRIGHCGVLAAEHLETLISMAHLASSYWHGKRWDESEKLDGLQRSNTNQHQHSTSTTIYFSQRSKACLNP